MNFHRLLFRTKVNLFLGSYEACVLCYIKCDGKNSPKFLFDKRTKSLNLGFRNLQLIKGSVELD